MDAGQPNSNQTPNTMADLPGVRRRGITFVVEGETAQIVG